MISQITGVRGVDRSSTSLLSCSVIRPFAAELGRPGVKPPASRFLRLDAKFLHSSRRQRSTWSVQQVTDEQHWDDANPIEMFPPQQTPCAHSAGHFISAAQDTRSPGRFGEPTRRNGGRSRDLPSIDTSKEHPHGQRFGTTERQGRHPD
jgi:hypothetical protein